MKNRSGTFSLSKSKQYFFSTAILLVFIFVLYNFQQSIGYDTVSLILILVLLLLPLFNFDKGPIILSAFISALAWDYYFIPPHLTMHIAKTEDAVMLVIFFIVAVTNSVLISRLKKQKNQMVVRDRRLNAQYTFTKDLSWAKDIDGLLKILSDHILKVFGFETIIFMPSDENRLHRDPHPASNMEFEDIEWLAAEVAFKDKTESGKSTNAVITAKAKYFPVIINDNVVCVIGIAIGNDIVANPDESQFLKDFLSELVPFLQNFLSALHHS